MPGRCQEGRKEGARKVLGRCLKGGAEGEREMAPDTRGAASLGYMCTCLGLILLPEDTFPGLSP